MKVQKIFDRRGLLLAFHVRRGLPGVDDVGCQFLTPPEYDQQVAVINHVAGKEIAPHKHTRYTKTVHSSSETLIINKGRLRYSIYDKFNQLVSAGIAVEGDVLTLIDGGHSFVAETEVSMIEVKQGPFLLNTKTFFTPGVSDAVATTSPATGD